MSALEQRAVAMLKAAGKTAATAESCTGGLLSARLTSVPGASEVFSCGICAYSANQKHRLLNVPEEIIARTGTVSAETASAMACGVRSLARADYGISVTGAAGPDPCEGHPPGTVFIAVCGESGSEIRALHLRGNREQIRSQTVDRALELLLAVLAGKCPENSPEGRLS